METTPNPSLLSELGFMIVIASTLLMVAVVMINNRLNSIRYRIMRLLSALLFYLVLVIIGLLSLLVSLSSTEELTLWSIRILIIAADLAAMLLSYKVSRYLVREREEE